MTSESRRKEPVTEIVISAYNNAHTLRPVLEGFARQADPDFGIVVADDGSGPEILALVNEFTPRLKGIRHVWHEDKGFRKTGILNAAVRTSNADYLIFVDADCIPERDFVADHKTFAVPGRFVAGRRVNLKSSVSQRLLLGQLSVDALSNRAYLLWLQATGRLSRVHFAMRAPWYIVNRSRPESGFRGCNMAMWRDDLARINGFDADITGHSYGEDSDIEWRLLRAGVEMKSLIYRGCVFHLHHPKATPIKANMRRVLEKKRLGQVRAVNGLVDESSFESRPSANEFSNPS